MQRKQGAPRRLLRTFLYKSPSRIWVVECSFPDFLAQYRKSCDQAIRGFKTRSP